MKRLLLAISLSLITLSAQAQTIDAIIRIPSVKPMKLAPLVNIKLTQVELKHWESQLTSLDIDNIEILNADFIGNALHVKVRVKALFLWDDLTIRVSYNKNEKALIQVQDNWLPSGILLERIQEKINDYFSTTLENETLTLKALKHERLAPTEYSIFLEDQKLFLKMTSKDSLRAMEALETGKPLKKASANFLSLIFRGGYYPQEDRGGFESHINLYGNESELEKIEVEGASLAKRVQNINLNWTLFTQIEKLGTPQWNAQGQFKFPNSYARMSGHDYDFKSVDFNWDLKPNYFEVIPTFKKTPSFIPQTKAHQLALFIDGPDYFKEMKSQLKSARKYVMQEIFVFYEGKKTNELVDLYLLKAAGLEDRSGKLLSSSSGISVFLMHNHKLRKEGFKKVAGFFERRTASLLKRLDAQGLDWKLYRRRIKKHMQLAGIQRGVAKTDHRKLLVIDGQMAYVGGLNLGDHYLTNNSFHDLMVQVKGPSVHTMEAEFRDNWKALSKAPLPKQAAPMPEQGKSHIQVLTTDDKGWAIEAAMLAMINNAQKSLKIEQAYFYYAPIQAALKNAIERGVHIEIIVSKKNDEPLFEVINPQSMVDLMQFAQNQKGSVKSFYYMGKGGDQGYMAHTKFLSADGQKALVGSANMIPRSLQSPFTQLNGEPFLFNEELNLYIDDATFVKELDQRLFEYDKVTYSKEMTFDELNQYKERGLWQVVLERIKGLLS